MKRTTSHLSLSFGIQSSSFHFLTFIIFLLFFLLSFLGQGAYCAEVSLAWDPNSEPDLAGYNIYYGTSSGNYQWVVDVGNVTTFTLNNLSFNTTYYIAATAYNTQGLESGYSNEVVYTADSCSYVISPSSASFPASGGTGSVTVTTQAGCNWGTSSGTSWLNITSGSGTGSGLMSYSVAANTGGTRVATLTIAGNVFTVTQSAVPVYTLTASAGTGGTISPSGGISVQSGGSQTFIITPDSGFKIAVVTVDGVAQGIISSYTFSTVNANHTISATFSSSLRQIPPIDDKKDKRGKAKTVFPIGDTVVKKGSTPSGQVQNVSTSSGPGNPVPASTAYYSNSIGKKVRNIINSRTDNDSGESKGSSHPSAPIGSGTSSYPETTGILSGFSLNGFRETTSRVLMESRETIDDQSLFPAEEIREAEEPLPSLNEKKTLQTVKSSSEKLIVRTLHGITYVYSEGAMDLPVGEDEKERGEISNN